MKIVNVDMIVFSGLECMKSHLIYIMVGVPTSLSAVKQPISARDNTAKECILLLVSCTMVRKVDSIEAIMNYLILKTLMLDDNN